MAFNEGNEATEEIEKEAQSYGARILVVQADAEDKTQLFEPR